MRVFDEDGSGWTLGAHIATGAEGAVFHLVDRPDWCVKIYHNRPLQPSRIAKLEALCALPSALRGCAAIPMTRVSETAGSARWCGVLIPFVAGHDIYELYNPQGRTAHFKQATFEFVVAAALNLARTFEVVHEHSIVVGDISEQNIRIRPDATLTFIDTDSFQVTAGGRVFPSNVGTPVWTPPELQGRSLEGTIRTRNHDRFGLAQLIFLLLFGGRYPFAGRPLSNHEPSIEEAIAKYAFAFDPAPAQRVLEPPPGAPRPEALPSVFMDLFLRAFCRGSERPDARPSSREWADALGHLRVALKRCPAWQNHVYWDGAGHCPWCDVLERVGFDLFPGPPVVRKNSGTERASMPDVEPLLKRLRSLNPQPLHLSVPTESQLRERLLESGASNPAWWISLTSEMGAIGRFLLSAPQRSLVRKIEEARLVVTSLVHRAAKLYLGYASALNALEKRAATLVGELESAAAWSTQASRQFQSRQREAARKRYLEGFLIRRFELQGLTQGRKASLLSHNIVTAADVTFQALRSVPGFPEQLAQRLSRWRADCEKGFRESSSPGIPPTVLAEAGETAKQQIISLCQQGHACLKQWESTAGRYAKEHGLLQSEFREASVKLALLEARLGRLAERQRSQPQ
jgi:DNA-binding helix-hairpin-helix protein with protein kinase domain